MLYVGNGKFKGDGVVSFFKKESVLLALQFLDGSEIRPGVPLKLERAVYQKKPEGFQPPPKKPRAKSKVDQSKELGWDEDDRRHVVIKNMFSPEEAVEELNFVKDLKDDLTREAAKCGPVEKVKVFERNPEGVVVIVFTAHEAAAKCINIMNGRFFAQRKLFADFYDGVTNYYVAESEESKAKRVQKFQQWLEEDSDKDEPFSSTTTTTTPSSSSTTTPSEEEKT